jgi:hypothetical protein
LGWDEDQCWTLTRIAEVIRARFRVGYTLAGVDLLLHRIGWSVQVPARWAAEWDEARIAAWREETWPVAIIEAGERGLADVLSSEFDPAPYALASVLTCCDMTTSPAGEPMLVEQRLAEIRDRYGPGDLVSRSIQRATPMIVRAVEQVHHRAAQTM